MSARKVVRKHIAANFDKETVDAKLKVSYKTLKQNLGFSVRMKMQKDQVIWLKATKLVTVFKVKITPTSICYYSPLQKNYFEGDFSMLKKLLGVEINFEQLQNLFLGQAMADLKNEKQQVEILENTHVLSPKIQSELFDIFFFVNPSHFKLDRQSIVNTEKNQRLEIVYPKYSLKDDVVFPDQIQISASQGQKFTKINFTTKSVIFDTEIHTTFRIPVNYKRIYF